MKELIIKENEADQRADKFLKKYLDKAESGFIYKMIRKKNITLNDKKMTGSEKLCEGDSIKIYFSEETFNKFVSDITSNTTQSRSKTANTKNANHFGKSDNTIKINHLRKANDTRIAKLLINISEIEKNIVYEDKNVILFNKPVGMLSQKAKPDDISANEILIQYMIETNKIHIEELKTFKPAVCNRLDRNTSGILIFGKTFAALQKFSDMLKKRELHKYYLCIVKGEIKSTDKIKGYLRKNEKNNLVEISENMCDGEYHYIETEYCPLATHGKYTLLKVLLITGKTHQIRAHLSSIRHPIIGDKKYGNKAVNEYFSKKYRLKNQLLHSYELKFEEMDGRFENLSYKSFKADLPQQFKMILEGEKINGNLEQQRS